MDSTAVSGVAAPFSNGPWHSTEAFIGPGTVTLSTKSLSNVPAPVNVEVVHFDGLSWQKNVYANALNRDITVDVNKYDPEQLSAVHFRVQGTFPGQMYRVQSNVPVGPSAPAWEKNIYDKLNDPFAGQRSPDDDRAPVNPQRLGADKWNPGGIEPRDASTTPLDNNGFGRPGTGPGISVTVHSIDLHMFAE